MGELEGDVEREVRGEMWKSRSELEAVREHCWLRKQGEMWKSGSEMWKSLRECGYAVGLTGCGGRCGRA